MKLKKIISIAITIITCLSYSALNKVQAKSANQAFQVKTIRPINIYNNDQFTGKKYDHIKKNKIINIQRITKYKGITRFQTESGHFITSNKYFVKIIK